MNGRTVLLVDDERHVLRVLRMALERVGYKVETANNGEEGVRKFVEINPDAVISDVVMPRMKGSEMILALTARFPDRRFPVVVMTSSLESEHRAWTDNIRDLTFIEKPVSPRELVGALDRCFSPGDSANAHPGNAHAV